MNFLKKIIEVVDDLYLQKYDEEYESSDEDDYYQNSSRKKLRDERRDNYFVYKKTKNIEVNCNCDCNTKKNSKNYERICKNGCNEHKNRKNNFYNEIKNYNKCEHNKDISLCETCNKIDEMNNFRSSIPEDIREMPFGKYKGELLVDVLKRKSYIMFILYKTDVFNDGRFPDIKEAFVKAISK